MEQISPEATQKMPVDILPKPHETSFGPQDATDYSRPLLMRRAEDLAQIAVLNFAAYETERSRFVSLVTDSVNEGTIRFGADFPAMNSDQQIQQFVASSINGALKPQAEVFQMLQSEELQLRQSAVYESDQLLLDKVDELKETVDLQGRRILKVRAMLVDRGATEEFLREFDYVTKLMAKPLQEIYEKELQLDPNHEAAPLVDTEEFNLMNKFRAVLATTFSKEALRKVGILAPISGEVQIIKQEIKSAQ